MWASGCGSIDKKNVERCSFPHKGLHIWDLYTARIRVNGPEREESNMAWRRQGKFQDESEVQPASGSKEEAGSKWLKTSWIGEQNGRQGNATEPRPSMTCQLICLKVALKLLAFPTHLESWNIT